MPLKRYSKNEPLVFLWIMVPYIFFMNLLIFGGCIFSSAGILLKSFLVSTVYFLLIYIVFGSVAVIIKNRFSSAADLIRRVATMLPVFYILNILAIHGVFYFYRAVFPLSCQPQENMVWWTILYGCIMSTVITFVNEGLDAWEKWKDSLSEGEKLENAYQRSKLFGLKGQINPHFLFNCFNTLSGLIQEDEEKAEQFLDEMTKVHRYLLQGDSEYLVTVSEEIKFAASYLSLTKSRFGQSVNYSINVPDKMLKRQLPPLSMQVILEHIIYTNALNRKDPLSIEITTDARHLVIRHSVHEKTILQQLNVHEGLDNLIQKYRLLNIENIEIREDGNSRGILLPLFTSTAVV